MTPFQMHNEFTQAVKSERKIMHIVLKWVQKFYVTKAFAELGYGSLYEYLVKGQGYAENCALARISAAKMMLEIPEVAEKLQEGVLNLTQLNKVKVALNQDQKSTGQKASAARKKEILTKIEGSTLHETEKILAEELAYNPPAKEKVLPRKEDYYLTFKLSKEQYEKLQKAQGLLSHVNIENNLADLIETMSDFVIQTKLGKKNFQTKTNRDQNTREETSRGSDSALEKQQDQIVAIESAAKNKTKRKFIPKPTKKLVYQKAEGCCEFVSPITGRKCGSRYQVQNDHRIPFSKGGSNAPENLRLLCRTHNLSEARKWGLPPRLPR